MGLTALSAMNLDVMVCEIPLILNSHVRVSAESTDTHHQAFVLSHYLLLYRTLEGNADELRGMNLGERHCVSPLNSEINITLFNELCKV
jgi:hypothetical protein